MADEDKIKTLRAILDDVNIEGLDLSSLTLAELEMMNTYHKYHNIQFNQKRENRLLPTSTANPDHLARRNAYVNQEIAKDWGTYRKSLEGQI